MIGSAEQEKCAFLSPLSAVPVGETLLRLECGNVMTLQEFRLVVLIPLKFNPGTAASTHALAPAVTRRSGRGPSASGPVSLLERSVYLSDIQGVLTPCETVQRSVNGC